MGPKSYLVTGGCGFLGSALVRRLVHDGRRVRVIDNNARGQLDRLEDVAGRFEFIEADVRDAEAVSSAAEGIDVVCHLAFVNGTEFFYSRPELVLDVGVKGMVNVIDACVQHHARELLLVSSSEVYHDPPAIPTNETVALTIPDPLNPRYSYSAGKIISEMMAINYGRRQFERVVIVRPHNVYGPNMGWEHVIPQFVLRMREFRHEPIGPVPFRIQGTGQETRSFVYIDDFVDGLMLALESGEHLGIYHVGTEEEITMEALATEVGRYFNREIAVVPSELMPGSPPRRCPDISKIARLGYRPRMPLRDGLPIVARWYDENAERRPRTTLKG